ncbi:outer membrane protein insertion porin family [Catalinimonas alkaloidigena]|uniref:translocation and assembly module lipoprotein TamL n=1 Tax=Catalinimonas alkaloidigena TaxID=1075417 RepID=UPI002407412F|nr:BamA/TamA family outer membrane protein [Catalinimonas alkaloidigena]MDF9794851.1 outer membrane protein insertion porin family [Catalinimonas alkaloidigena]
MKSFLAINTVPIYRILKSISLTLLTGLLLSSCLGTRYLDEGEYLLYKQNIKKANKVNEDDLSDFYRQEPNRKFPVIPFTPFVWIYHIGQDFYDEEELREDKQDVIDKYNTKIEKAEKEKKIQRLEKKKEKKTNKIDRKLEEGNLLMRWGEPLSIYDSSQAEITRQQMENYLHTKGYFNGSVDHGTTLEGRKITSNYTINERLPYSIDTITYLIQDSVIRRLIHESFDERLVREGQVYDQEKLSQERERIETLLRNNGFYDFSRQYVEYEVDSTISEREVRINTLIREPAKRGYHKRFKIDSVIFVTDSDIGTDRTLGLRKSSEHNNIVYRYYEYQYYKKILDRRIFIYPDSLYSLEESLQTQRQLSNLDVFKFININYDTTGNHFVARVYASPLKKYQTSNEVGLNVSQGLPGPFINSSLKIRNVFGGLEIMELNARAGIEGVPPPSGTEGQGAYRSVDAGGNLSVTFPQFIFPLPEEWKSHFGVLNPRTRLQTGYNYTDRQEYVRTNFNTSLSYTWQKQQKISYTFTPVDINLIDSRNISDAFQNILDTQDSLGIPLSRSFEPSFVSSINFSTIFNFNNYGNYADRKNSASYLKLYLESGGTIFNFINPDIVTDRGLEYFKYVKVNTDYRKYIPISRTSDLAYRLNIGVAVPYGDTTGNVLPYEKYFFAGGSNSIRAWRPRRLGPGGSPPQTPVDEDGYFVYNNEQPGEILLEASVELRRELFGFVSGAFFIDAGNVWLFYETQSRPAANFELDSFYKQIAVGSGLGLRLDFSFLIIRFDYGVKMYDPARDAGQRWIGQKFDVWDEVSHGVFNIGIGYPF